MEILATFMMWFFVFGTVISIVATCAYWKSDKKRRVVSVRSSVVNSAFAMVFWMLLSLI